MDAGEQFVMTILTTMQLRLSVECSENLRKKKNSIVNIFFLDRFGCRSQMMLCLALKSNIYTDIHMYL